MGRNIYGNTCGREGLVFWEFYIFFVISFFLYGYELAIDEPL